MLRCRQFYFIPCQHGGLIILNFDRWIEDIDDGRVLVESYDTGRYNFYWNIGQFNNLFFHSYANHLFIS